MDFQKVWQDMKRSWIFTSVFFIAAGLILVFFPGPTLTSISYVLGFLSIVMGVIRTVRYFRQDHGDPFLFQSDLMVGLLSVGFGLFMLTKPEMMMGLMPLVFGILLSGCGVGGILRAVDAKRAGVRRWGVLLALSIVSIALGWLIMANPFGAIETVVAVIGGCMVYVGATDLFATLTAGKRIDEWKKAQKESD